MQPIKLERYYPKYSEAYMLFAADDFSRLMFEHCHPKHSNMAYPDEFEAKVRPLLEAHGVTEIIYPD